MYYLNDYIVIKNCLKSNPLNLFLDYDASFSKNQPVRLRNKAASLKADFGQNLNPPAIMLC